MKKFLSLVLTLTLTISFSACSGGDKPASAPESSKSAADSAPAQSKEQKQGAPAEMGDLLSSAYAGIMKNGKFYMHYKGAIQAEGQTINMEAKTAVDGDNMATQMQMDEGMSMHLLVKDNVSYLMDDTTKTYSKLDMPQQESGLGDTETMEYVGKGTAAVNGKEMAYEEYKIADGTMRYYFDGKKLYAIAMKNGDSETVMEVLELSDKIPAGMMEIPAGYTEGVGDFGGATIPEELLDEETEKQLEELQNQFSDMTPEDLAALEKQAEELQKQMENAGYDVEAEE